MKTGTHTIEVEAQIILNRRELQLLHHIFSYDLGMKGFISSHYAGGVTEKELTEFAQMVRGKTANLIDQIEDAKTKLFKNP